jgi:hypothetical protein
MSPISSTAGAERASTSGEARPRRGPPFPSGGTTTRHRIDVQSAPSPRKIRCEQVGRFLAPPLGASAILRRPFSPFSSLPLTRPTMLTPTPPPIHPLSLPHITDGRRERGEALVQVRQAPPRQPQARAREARGDQGHLRQDARARVSALGAPGDVHARARGVTTRRRDPQPRDGARVDARGLLPQPLPAAARLSLPGLDSFPARGPRLREEGRAEGGRTTLLGRAAARRGASLLSAI